MIEKRPITSVDVAKLAGVSQVTVSRTLSGNTPVSDKTRTRVMEAVQELGYRPNSAARAARTGKTGNIGLLLSTEKSRSRIEPELIQSIHDALNEKNLHLTVSIMKNEQLTDKDKVPRLLTDLLADGLICNYTHDIPPALLEMVSQYNIPVIWVNASFDHDCILPNDFEAGRLATEHLIAQGHRSIGYVAFVESGHYSEESRLAGYQAAMESAGLEPNVRLLHTTNLIKKEPTVDDNRLDLCLSYLQEPDLPTAVVTYSMATVYPLWAGAQKLGRNIPEDLSIITIGDTLKNPFGKTISTVILPAEKIGRQAVEAVLKKVKRPSEKLPPTKIKPVLYVGSSTTKAPS